MKENIELSNVYKQSTFLGLLSYTQHVRYFLTEAQTANP